MIQTTNSHNENITFNTKKHSLITLCTPSKAITDANRPIRTSSITRQKRKTTFNTEIDYLRTEPAEISPRCFANNSQKKRDNSLTFQRIYSREEPKRSQWRDLLTMAVFFERLMFSLLRMQRVGES